MRVDLLADSPHERWVSMERYAQSLYRSLKRVAPEVNFRLLVPPDPPSMLRGRLFLLWRMLVYPFWASHSSADVVHVLDHSYGHLLLGMRRKKAVVTLHDLAPIRFPSGNRFGLSHLAWNVSLKSAFLASQIVTVSEFTKKELISCLPELSSKPVAVVYSGVDAHFLPLSPKQKKRFKERLTSCKWLILHVGSCQPRKNIETLIRALAMLEKRKLDFCFLQVGGLFSQHQQDLIRSLGLEKRVHQIPRVREQQLVRLYNAADVFVFPSLYEGFGFPVLEAMACGTPVIASSSASLPEIAGEAAQLVNPLDPQQIAETIFTVLSDSVLASELRERGIERAKHFSWEKTAREMLPIYASLAS